FKSLLDNSFPGNTGITSPLLLVKVIGLPFTVIFIGDAASGWKKNVLETCFTFYTFLLLNASELLVTVSGFILA
ncbi:hypothetical protein, partial [Zoogloea sp. 1C4]|uniref:hypothetical protein n=1 Tax=Zoogloea sp. 1C4 TaxID=2570190 RepID=UPI001D17235D